MDSTPDPALVRAAQAGDRPALEQLLADHLTLVYNVVGRALNGHPDVDDVVQETMLRAVQALAQLREPDRFRSWLIAIAIRQVHERGRSRGSETARQRPLADWPDLPDPDTDVAGATIRELGLSAQRREVAAATGWLAADDRRLLALWWQEVAGTLTRAELAAALGVSQPHAAVRVQRMKAQLDLARTVARAWRTLPRCAGLGSVSRDWDGRIGPDALRRLGRHVRGCPRCQRAAGSLVPAEFLLAGAALLPVPALLAGKFAGLLGTGGAAAGGAAAGSAAAGSAAAGSAAAGSAAAATTHAAAAAVGGAHARAVTGHAGLVAAPALTGLRRLFAAMNLKTAVLGGSALAGAGVAVVFAVYYLPLASPDDPAGAAPSAVASAVVSASPSRAGAASAAPSAPAAPVAPPLTGVAVADLYVAPDGNDANPGTLQSPLASLNRAVTVVVPGQVIAVRGGAYRPTSPVTITTSGTADKRITLSNYRDEQPVIDASAIRSNQWYVTQRASYWTVQGLTVHSSPTFPFVCVSCQHNVYQRLSLYGNGDTALVLRGAGTVGNTVLDSDFHDNHDDAKHGANADGVAFKDGSGAGNVIRGCRAFRNSDDGVDLSGFADPVTVEHNWAYGNGVNRWGLTGYAGGGVGFRLGGGDPTPNVNHLVTDNAAWDNTGYGFTEQNNKGVIAVTGNTAYRNGKDGFAFWYSPSHLSGNLALANGRDDNRGEVTQESGNSWNEPGWSVAVLRGTDPTSAEGPRRPDGSLPATTFLTTTRPGAGATMTP